MSSTQNRLRMRVCSVRFKSVLSGYAAVLGGSTHDMLPRQHRLSSALFIALVLSVWSISYSIVYLRPWRASYYGNPESEDIDTIFELQFVKKNCKKLFVQEYSCNEVKQLPTAFGKKETSLSICYYDLVADTEYLPEPSFIRCLETASKLFTHITLEIKQGKTVTDEAVNFFHDYLESTLFAMKRMRNQLFKNIHHLQHPLDCNRPNSAEKHKPVWIEGRDEQGFLMKLKNTDLHSQSRKAMDSLVTHSDNFN